MNGNIKGKFYAIGVGPGDPELLTIKAIKQMAKCDIIAVPQSQKHSSDNNIALKIAKEYIKEKTIVELYMPMSKDENLLNEYHKQAADKIEKYLNDNKSVGFLTLGDPTIYSTVMYIHEIITANGYSTNIIPGITSFCAAACSLNKALCKKDEMLHIIPATFADVNKALNFEGTKVLMKSGKTFNNVVECLKENNISADAVECATMGNEKIFVNIDKSNIKNDDISYFSLIITK